jgi:hypothetical protein
MASLTGFLFNTELTIQRLNTTSSTWLSVIYFSPGSFGQALHDGLDNKARWTRDVKNRSRADEKNKPLAMDSSRFLAYLLQGKRAGRSREELRFLCEQTNQMLHPNGLLCQD